MTDWRTLEAGPELDRIVAERVFGVVFVDQIDTWNAPPMRASVAYTTAWDGMGLVVERMRELGWHWSGVNRLSDNEWSGAASFLFGNGPYPIENTTHAEAPTVPLATCRAALAALEAK